MAPKRSKGIRIEGDSYNHDLFRSKEVALSFPKFETRCVHKGKYVDLDELEDLDPIKWFAQLEALPLLQIDEPIYPRLVRLFYTNLYEDNDSLSTYILVINLPYGNIVSLVIISCMCWRIKYPKQLC